MMFTLMIYFLGFLGRLDCIVLYFFPLIDSCPTGQPYLEIITMSFSFLLVVLSTIMLATFILLILLKSKNKQEESYEKIVRNLGINVLLIELLITIIPWLECALEYKTTNTSRPT